MRKILQLTFSLLLVSTLQFQPRTSGQTRKGSDETVKLWNVETRQQLRPLTGAGIDVTSLAFSRDGGTLAVGSREGKIELWDVKIGKLRLPLAGHTSEVTSLSFSPDGKLVASSSLDSTIRVWNVNSGTQVQLLTGHYSAVLCVGFHPNGEWLVSGSQDETVRLWDIKSGHEYRTLKGHSGAITALALSPNGELLASLGTDNTIRVWEVATGRVLRTLLGHPSGVSSLSFSPDGKVLATGGTKDYSIKIWNIESGAVLRSLQGHVSSVDSLTFSADGATLASGSLDQTVSIWDVRSGNELYTFEGHSEKVTAVAFSPNGTTLATGSALDLPRKPNLYVLAVGVSQYREARLNLRYAVADTTSLAMAFEKGAERSSLYNRVQTVFMSDSAVTGVSIEDALNRIVNEAEPQDTFIFFYEGHAGVLSDSINPEGLYLVPSDVRGIEDLKERGLSVKKLRGWSAKIQALHQMLILDLVQSDHALQGLSVYASRVIEENSAIREFIGNSKVVLTGIESLQAAFENGQLGHGSLTYALLQGLQGDADSNRDGVITANELAEFAAGRQRTLAKGLGMTSRSTYAVGLDFPIAVVSGGRVSREGSDRRNYDHSTKNAHSSRLSKAQGQPKKRSEPIEANDKIRKGAAVEFKGKNYALLFATDTYDELDKLNNPIFDAETIANELRTEYGFAEAKVYPNLTLYEILKVITTEYGGERQYSDEDQLFIFFAGHGTYDKANKIGFIAAKDSKKGDELHLSYLAYPILIPYISSIKCKHIFLVADVCKGGAIRRSAGNSSNASEEESSTDDEEVVMSIPAFIRRKSRLITRQFMTSGSELDYVSDGRPGHHSPFANGLIQTLKRKGGGKGYLKISNILDEVELVKPGPVWGRFADDVEGSTFFFVPHN